MGSTSRIVVSVFDLINQGNGQFQDIQGDWSYPAGAAGLRFQETHSIPSLGDFDNDGILDWLDIDPNCDLDDDNDLHLLNGSRFRDDGPNSIDTDIDGDGLAK